MKRITVTLDDETLRMLDHIASQLTIKVGHIGRAEVTRMALRSLYQDMTGQRYLQPAAQEERE